MAPTHTRSQEQTDEGPVQQDDKLTIAEKRRRRLKRRHSESEPETPVLPASQRKDRPTPSARQIKARGVGSTGLINRIPVVRGIATYFRGVYSELQKVTWPSREETTRLTGVVLGVTIAFALSLGLLDVFYGWWFKQAFSKDSEWIFLVIAAAATVLVGGSYAVFKKRL